MSPGERCDAIIDVLSIALVRIASAPSDSSPECTGTCLDLSRDARLSVPTGEPSQKAPVKKEGVR